MTKKTRSTHTLKLVRGGKRDGAGRPQGSGKYGEPTKAIRVPQSLVSEIQHLLTQYGQEKTFNLPPFASKTQFYPPLHIPLYANKVPAGLPSPAEDYVETTLDLNEHVIKNPTATFYIRAQGNSMLGAGIHPNDILVVDLSLEPRDGHVVIALVGGEFTVKRLQIKNKQLSLHPENEDYAVIIIKEDMDFRIWGVVTNVIHSLV